MPCTLRLLKLDFGLSLDLSTTRGMPILSYPLNYFWSLVIRFAIRLGFLVFSAVPCFSPSLQGADYMHENMPCALGPSSVLPLSLSLQGDESMLYAY